MTLYNNSLTIIAPESIFDGANALAQLFGESGTIEPPSFRTPSRTKAGKGYAWISPAVKAGIAGMVQALAAGQAITLQRPAWDAADGIDLAAAQGVLDGALVITEFDAEAPPAWDGERLIIALNVDANSIMAAYGLVANADL